MRVEATFKWERPLDKIGRDITDNERLLTFGANEFRKIMDPFVPMDTGTLAREVQVGAQDGAGYVEYTAPYAKPNYEGWPDEKRQFSKEKHPLATHHWDKAALAVRGKDLENAMQNFIDKQKWW